MKILTNILAALLGLLFIASAATILFKLIPPDKIPQPPEGSLPWHFNKAFMDTGYMTLVKVCELVGGLLLAIPRTRNIGLLILGPIIINILAFHAFVAKEGVFSPMLIGIVVVTLFLLWAGRHEFAGLVRRRRSTTSEPMS